MILCVNFLITAEVPAEGIDDPLEGVLDEISLPGREQLAVNFGDHPAHCVQVLCIYIMSVHPSEQNWINPDRDKVQEPSDSNQSI